MRTFLSRLTASLAVHPGGHTDVSEGVAADLAEQARRRARIVAWAGLLVNLPLFYADEYVAWTTGAWAESPRYHEGLLAWRITAVVTLAVYLWLDRRSKPGPALDRRLATGLAVWFLVLGGWFGAYLVPNPFAFPLYAVTLFVVATLIHPPSPLPLIGYLGAFVVCIGGALLYGTPASVVSDLFEGPLLVAVLAMVVYRSIYRQSYRTAASARLLARSNADLSATLDELRRTQSRLVDAERQAERAWISRDLHDSVGAQLSNLLAGVELARLEQRLGDASRDVLGELESDARAAITDLRETIWALQTDTLSLDALGRRLAAFAEPLAHRAGMTVTVKPAADAELSPTQALHLYRVGQEAIQNAVKHSGGRAIGVALERAGETLSLTVTDDGTFGPAATSTMAVPSGFGMGSMEARASALGGALTLTTGTQTTVRVDVPAKAPAFGGGARELSRAAG